MAYLFEKEITDWHSWGTVYQSIADFRSLIEEIFTREQLTGAEHLSHLTPGSNAVFRAGSYVIKIFAPKESGADTENDYQAELASMRRAIGKGIGTPKIISASRIQDKYLFLYFIMEYIDGYDAGDVLKGYTSVQKHRFVHELKDHLKQINTPPAEDIGMGSILEKVESNPRWNVLPEPVRQQIPMILQTAELSPCVFVHGDITAENVRIDPHGHVYLIDFADSTIAPVEYEYPPIICSLFDLDSEMTREFFRDMNHDCSVDKLFTGILLHAFGSYFVKEIYERFAGKEVSELTDILEIRQLLYAWLK